MGVLGALATSDEGEIVGLSDHLDAAQALAQVTHLLELAAGSIVNAEAGLEGDAEVGDIAVVRHRERGRRRRVVDGGAGVHGEKVRWRVGGRRAVLTVDDMMLGARGSCRSLGASLGAGRDTQLLHASAGFWNNVAPDRASLPLPGAAEGPFGN